MTDKPIKIRVHAPTEAIALRVAARVAGVDRRNLRARPARDGGAMCYATITEPEDRYAVSWGVDTMDDIGELLWCGGNGYAEECYLYLGRILALTYDRMNSAERMALMQMLVPKPEHVMKEDCSLEVFEEYLPRQVNNALYPVDDEDEDD
ncbi:hypothetical protein KHP60_21165 [Microvirga sp. 3-52]|uniref:hypothetical protein n=1 Tax=Microvirga sp. 3-52 TaxID=2792425 RepID=UPI001AC82FD3|nr:hypothetical protein [Microvirga sp. 3-52]MBO1907024.1 hypothetical protein [Microvirga sp. 3-52]MBS7454820.1 hypothetical protein [Microvirga sp. 3-52]